MSDSKEGPQLVEQVDGTERRSNFKVVVLKVLKSLIYFILSPIFLVSFVVAFVINAYSFITGTVTSIVLPKGRKIRKISEKTSCPACGWKSGVRMNFTYTQGPEQAAVELTCLNCGAKFYLALREDAKKWLAPFSNQTSLKEKVKNISL